MTSFLLDLPDEAWLAIGVTFLVLGVSFLYKGWCGAILGRAWYWQGFLPFTLISPWLIHIPPREPEKTLIKKKEGIVCHLIIGPLMFVTAIPLLIVGSDLVGLPGTDFTNLVLSGGDVAKPSSIVYTPKFTYKLPIIGRIQKQLWKVVDSEVDEDPNKKMIHKRYQK